MKKPMVLAMAAVAGLAAVAAGVKNDTPELRAKVEALKDGETLKLERRDYHFFQEGAKDVHLAIPGSSWGVKRVTVPIIGKKNVTIDGNGAKIYVHGHAFPFLAQNCEGVTVKNLSLQCHELPVKELEVVAKDEKGFTLQLHPEGPKHQVVDGQLLFTLQDGSIKIPEGEALKTRIISLHALKHFQIHYVLNGDNVPKKTKDALASSYMSATAEDVGGNRIRYTYLKDEHQKLLKSCPFALNDPICIGFAGREICQMFFSDCRDVKVSDVRVFNGAGMGIIAWMCHNLDISRYRVEPPKGSLVSLTADSMYVVDCSGEVNIADSVSCWGLDDPLNVHGDYRKVVACNGAECTLGIVIGGQVGVWPYRVGETVEFSTGHGGSRKTLGFAKIAAFEKPADTAEVAKVVFDKPIPAEWKGMRVANYSHRPKVTLRGNYFHDGFNTRLSAFGDYLLEDNVWERTENSTYADDLTDYYGECGPIHDFTARNNIVLHPRGWGWGFAFLVKPTGRVSFEGNRYVGVGCARPYLEVTPEQAKNEREIR